MDLLRDVDRSVRDKVADLFIQPVAGSLITNSYQIFDETYFTDEAFDPKPPFIWLLLSRVPPRKTRLPLVMIDRMPTRNSEFELGNRLGTLFDYNLHVFARNRGERETLAGYLFQNLLILPIYTYGVSARTLLYTVSIDQRASTPVR